MFSLHIGSTKLCGTTATCRPWGPTLLGKVAVNMHGPFNSSSSNRADPGSVGQQDVLGVSQWMDVEILNQVTKKEKRKEAPGNPQVRFRVVTRISLMGHACARIVLWCPQLSVPLKLQWWQFSSWSLEPPVPTHSSQSWGFHFCETRLLGFSNPYGWTSLVIWVENSWARDGILIPHRVQKICPNPKGRYGQTLDIFMGS